MKPLRLLAVARSEVNEAADFYEGRRPGLGKRWRLAVAEVLDEVQRHPHIGRKTVAGPRKHRFSGFPFHIIFMERSDDILIVSFAHNRREPGFWLDRI